MMLMAVSLWAERAGPYIGTGVALANYDDDNRLESISKNSQEALRIYGGAYINENFSVEVDYATLMKFEGVSKSGGSVDNEFSIFSVAALAHYPVADNTVDLYAKFGAGQIFWKESGSESHESDAAALLFGVGIGYRLMEALTLNFGYDYFTFGMDVSEEQSYDMALGLTYMKIEVQF